MSDVDKFFKRLHESDKQQAEQQRQLSFQERIVKQLLRYANVPINVALFKQEAMAVHGHADLDFRWFAEKFPGFPVFLMSEKIKFTHTIKMADIYGQSRFRKLSWWKQYMEQADLAGIDLKTERAALLFNLPHAKDAFLMTLHNQPIQNQVFTPAEEREDPWPRTIFPMAKEGVTIVLESFKSFMQTVGTDWAPQDGFE